ncbi:MAG TPA: PaaX domain-containing protein, C- domain protein [Nocardioidaceae bacterium]|nr:PaaX domain-containing protein, C- domain protein [Nocardioidaceae bacterium]
MSHPAIRPVSTRSALLTLLIGGPRDVGVLEAAQLVTFAGTIGINESTARVALSRMVSSGDLVRGDDGYALSERLADRRARQRAALDPALKRWRGDWELVVVTHTGRAAADRAALRVELVGLRLAELREGVWLRPDNLQREWEDEAVRRHVSRPVDDARELAASLWDLPAWVTRGEEILGAIEAARSQSDRFAACVAGVRHLLTDPVLPEELRPEGWPAPRIRAAYDESLRWMASLI